MDPTSTIIRDVVCDSQVLGMFVCGNFVQCPMAPVEGSQSTARRLSYKVQPCQKTQSPKDQLYRSLMGDGGLQKSHLQRACRRGTVF